MKEGCLPGLGAHVPVAEIGLGGAGPGRRAPQTVSWRCHRAYLGMGNPAWQLSPCGLVQPVKPGVGLGTEASASKPPAWTRPASSQDISPASPWSHGYRHCHHRCLVGGIPEKQGCVGRRGEDRTGLGSRQMLMRPIRPGSYRETYWHLPAGPPEADPAQAPGTSARQMPREFPASQVGLALLSGACRCWPS